MSSKHEYDALVLGGGAAGLTASGIAANFGAKTVMIEADRLGGDCTWTGCVPSKTLIKAAKVAHHITHAGKYGLVDGAVDIDFKKLIRHIHRIREEIYEEADKPEHFEKMGVEVVHGKASFLDDRTIEITTGEQAGRMIRARYVFICAGGSALVPPIKGIEKVDYLTSESLFEISSLPKRMIVIGAGPIGIEMAQALQRLGSMVTVLDMAGNILQNDDPEIARMLQKYLEKEGVEFVLNGTVEQVSQEGDTVSVIYSRFGKSVTLKGDGLLIAAGRKPNIDGLNLDSTGVNYSRKGIETDKRCRTNVGHIYACGDVTGRYQFTHMSEHMARVATTHALLKLPMKIDTEHIPWVTYTDPELGHLGATIHQLNEQGTSFETYRFPYTKVDRAAMESETGGLIKVYAKKWSGKILGADVLGASAGEIISEYAVSMRNGLTLRDIADTIHPYPSYGLATRRAADQWYIKNQKSWMVKVIRKIFGYRGDLPDFSDSDRIV